MNKISLRAVALSSAAAALMLSGVARADLIGDVIKAEYDYPALGTSYEITGCGGSCWSVNPFTVGTTGIETLGFPNEFGPGTYEFSVDFSANSLTITHAHDISYLPTSFNGPTFSVVSGDPFDPIASVTGIPAGDVFFAPDGALAINWSALAFSVGDKITVDFAVPGAAVPEPSTWAMMLVGFAGLAFAGWRARRRSVSIAA
jgi:hypothetical protein